MSERVNPDEIIEKLPQAIQELLRQRDELDQTYQRDRQVINDKLETLGHTTELTRKRRKEINL